MTDKLDTGKLNTDHHNAWDLFRRGNLDQKRHIKLIKKAIKENITDLITHGKIVSGDKVVIPVRELRQWKFEYEKKGEEGTVIVEGDPKEGDVIGKKPDKGKGNQPGGDGDHDEGYFEVVVDAESVSEILFEDLELPNVQKKQPKDYFKEEYVQESVSKKGIMPNLDKKRTVIQNIKRNAAKGDPKFKSILDDDLRYKTDTIKRIPQDKVVVFFIRDRSASMGETKKHLTRVFAFWIIKFLNFKYKKMVEDVYVLFDTEAEETTQEEFITKSEGGGTKVSTGINLADDIVNKRYPPSHYNIYFILFTDGDNWGEDNKTVMDSIDKVLPYNNLFGCANIKGYGSTSYYTSSSDSAFIINLKKLEKNNLVVVDVTDQEDILVAMKSFFKKGG